MVQNSEDSPLLELTFLTSLGYYHTGETKTAYIYFKNTFYAAHSIESCYASICRNYVSNEHMFALDDYLSQMDDIPQITFPIKNHKYIRSNRWYLWLFFHGCFDDWQINPWTSNGTGTFSDFIMSGIMFKIQAFKNWKWRPAAGCLSDRSLITASWHIRMRFYFLGKWTWKQTLWIKIQINTYTSADQRTNRKLSAPVSLIDYEKR